MKKASVIDDYDTGGASSRKKSKVAHYVIDEGAICEMRGVPPYPSPLANFDARIIEHQIVDDGQEEAHALVISGSLASGKPLPPVTVPAAKFAGMAWPLESWGPRAIVAAGQGSKDKLREAMQVLSEPTRRRVYSHIGWTLFGEAPVYLHAGGGIGRDGSVSGVEVTSSEALNRYVLRPPRDDAERRRAIATSLSIRNVAPLMVSAPLLAMIGLAPLQALLGEEIPDFVLGFFGESGKMKSELAALGQGHFGNFTRKSLKTFSATSNSIERALFDAKDAICVIDDFHPGQSRYEEQDLNAKLARLLRSMGERSGRGRMNRDLTAQRDFPPRALPIVTGEREPRGYSGRGRLFPVEVAPQSVKLKELSRLQESRALFPVTMAGYVQWIARYFERLCEWLPVRFRFLRSSVLDELRARGGHAREPGQLAHLELGLETFVLFAETSGAIDKEKTAAFLKDARDALLGLALEHAEDAPQEKATTRFLALLADGFASKAIYVEELKEGGSNFEGASRWGWDLHNVIDKNGDAHGELRTRNNAILIGWIDESFLYLLPETAIQYVNQAAARAHEVFPVGLRDLCKRLKEERLTRWNKGRHLARIRRKDSKPWVIQITRRLCSRGEQPC